MEKKVLHVAAAVIRRGGKVLLSTRPAEKPPAGLEVAGVRTLRDAIQLLR